MQLIHALALLVLTSNAAAKCCSKGKCTYLAWDGQKNRCTRWECKDGAQVSMFECCGYRKCNVFCCNCDAAGDGSVCRVSNRDLSEDVLTAQDAMTDEEMFQLANTDGSGQMTLAQFAAYLGGEKDDEDVAAKFKAYDGNGDGFLSVDEMRLPSPQQQEQKQHSPEKEL